MFCRFCGKEIEDGSLFCRFCGAELKSLQIDDKKTIVDQSQSAKSNENKPKPVEEADTNTIGIDVSSDVSDIQKSEEIAEQGSYASVTEAIVEDTTKGATTSEPIKDNAAHVKEVIVEKPESKQIVISKRTGLIVGIIIVALVIALAAIGLNKMNNSNNQGADTASSEETTADNSGVLDGLFSSTGSFIGTWYADKELEKKDEDDYFDRVSASITINEDGTYIETINGDNRKGTWEETDKGSKILVLTRDGDDYSNETFEKHGDKFVLNTVYWESFSLDVVKAPNKVKVPVGTWYGEKDVNDEYFDHLTATITVKEDGTYTETISGDTRTGKWVESSPDSGILILTRDGDDYSNETFEVHGENHILNTVYWETLSFDMQEN